VLSLRRSTRVRTIMKMMAPTMAASTGLMTHDSTIGTMPPT
jgi:hypothetical protein